MNIMLVSFTGRARETGIGKAMGAKRYPTLLQFLFEPSSCMTGLLCGYGIGLGRPPRLKFSALVGIVPRPPRTSWHVTFPENTNLPAGRRILTEVMRDGLPIKWILVYTVGS